MLSRCSPCGLGSAVVNLKPPTAAGCIMTIDGGRIRGVLILECLGKIQSALGSGCDMSAHFDLIVNQFRSCISAPYD